MAKSAVINMRVDPELKEECQQIFESKGISTSKAINLFLLQCIKEKGIPSFVLTSSKTIES